MERLGIRTGADLRARSLEELVRHFGKAGRHFHAIARAEDQRRVQPDRPRKSSGSERTYAEDLTTAAAVEAALAPLAAEVWAWCERTGARGRTVTLKLRYSDFRTLTRSRTGAGPVPDGAALEATAIALARGLLPLEKPVRLLGVTLSGFEDEETGQPSLDL